MTRILLILLFSFSLVGCSSILPRSITQYFCVFETGEIKPYLDNPCGRRQPVATAGWSLSRSFGSADGQGQTNYLCALYG